MEDEDGVGGSERRGLVIGLLSLLMVDEKREEVAFGVIWVEEAMVSFFPVPPCASYHLAVVHRC